MIVKDAFNNNESYTHINWRYQDVCVGFSILYYIIDGEAYYEENGKTVRLKKGHLYLTPVKTPFTLYENAEDKLLHTYVHIFTIPAVRSFTEISVNENSPLVDAVALWRKYANCTDKALLVNIIQLVLSCIDREIGKENKVARLTKRYIDELDGTGMNMSEMTRSIGYTREHITRAFTAAYRMTPVQYMNSRKMEMARISLENGTSVKETANILGYANPYSFSKSFKRYYGVSPEAYLKTVR